MKRSKHYQDAKKSKHHQLVHTTMKMKGKNALRKVFDAVLRKYRKRSDIHPTKKSQLWQELHRRYKLLSFTFSNVDLFVGSRL